MTDEELETIEKRVKATTPGPWHAIRTDDEWFQNATYVGLDVRGRLRNGLYSDHGRGKKRLAEGEGHLDPERVVAVTLLQYPNLVYQDECDENAAFIAHARDDVPALIDEVRRLRRLLAERGDDR